jgi:hypothetical protein
LDDPSAARCVFCGQRLKGRHAPRQLGEERLITQTVLPMDRWMLVRVSGEPERRSLRPYEIAPPAWSGKFIAAPAWAAKLGGSDVLVADPPPAPEVAAAGDSNLDPEVQAIVAALYDQARAQASEPPAADTPTD